MEAHDTAQTMGDCRLGSPRRSLVVTGHGRKTTISSLRSTEKKKSWIGSKRCGVRTHSCRAVVYHGQQTLPTKKRTIGTTDRMHANQRSQDAMRIHGPQARTTDNRAIETTNQMHKHRRADDAIMTHGRQRLTQTRGLAHRAIRAVAEQPTRVMGFVPQSRTCSRRRQYVGFHHRDRRRRCQSKSSQYVGFRLRLRRCRW